MIIMIIMIIIIIIMIIIIKYIVVASFKRPTSCGRQPDGRPTAASAPLEVKEQWCIGVDRGRPLFDRSCLDFPAGI
ncbi:hypothetical protein EYF80_024779 [Liparis tanakae]|uniref:Uncharacterized protein n=1 Tax=Liparis tanakae TaxID=230148 RepID=A0A4Z2HHM7_9TELE|nr:hypothetical protein EYF80_024779 [Liparis tanakae]